MYYDTVAEFYRGVRDYWSGIVPDRWEDVEIRNRSPYLMGWYMESMADNDQDWMVSEGDLS